MMSNQIFRKTIPKEIFFDLLEKICIKTDKYYLFDLNAYRKLLFYKLDESFCKNLQDYYHFGKRMYVERKMTYNNFTTILRQICNLNKITYTSLIKYDKSDYTIHYYIYF